MRKSYEFQLDRITNIESKFSGVLLKGRSTLDDADFVMQELENIIGEIRGYLLNYYLEEGALLKLFGILEAAMDKRIKIRNM